MTAPGHGGASTDTLTIRKPQCDLRQYRAVMLPNGLGLLLVSDPEATFAAACANVRAGYFDDPETVPGLAHFLEHAVHLGSNKYPDPKAYKSFLSQHGGSSNASTSMVHTSFHFKVHHQHVQGALDRFAQFFVSPLLLQDAALAEVENVHAEFSRNCNSDARKLLQLRRTCLGSPYNKFSTGNATTLRDTPLQQGLPVQQLLRQYWDRRYTGDALCCCIVAPQPLDQLEQWAATSFADVRPGNNAGHTIDMVNTAAISKATATADSGQEPASSSLASHDEIHTKHTQADGSSANGGALEAVADVWQDWPLDYSRLVGPGQLGLLYRVRPQRELRELEVQWYIPYGSMQDVRCKPWRWVGHLLGHEAHGSLAYSLKQAGLVQSLMAGLGDEVRLGRGFMFWGLTLSLTEAGVGQEQLLLEAIYEALRVIKAVPDTQRREIHEELQQLSKLNFEYQDRQEPLDLAKDAANRLHYFPVEELLSGPALIHEYDGQALDRFLSHLVPETMNVYFSSQHHPREATPHKEQWYGAKYGVEPLGQELVACLHARMHAGEPLAASQGSDVPGTAPQASTAAVPRALQPLPILPLHLPGANWALPVSTVLCQPSSSMDPADVQHQQDNGHTFGDAVKQSNVPAAKDLGSLPAAEGASPSRCVSDGLRHRPCDPPVLVTSSPGLQTWHQTDVSLALPKMYVYLDIVTPETYRSARHWVLSRLYCRLLNDLLEPQVYFAQLAATSYSLSCSETGLVLQIRGYSSVVHQLLAIVLQAMASGMLDPSHVQRRFGVHQGQLRQAWQVWAHNNPLSHAEYHTDFLLQQPHWHVIRDGLALLQQDGAVGSDDVHAWAATFASGAHMHVNMLGYGNTSPKETQDLAQLVQQQLKPCGLSIEHWPEPHVLQLLLAPEDAAAPADSLGHGANGVVASLHSGLEAGVQVSTGKLAQGYTGQPRSGEPLVTPAGADSALDTGEWRALNVCYQPSNPNPGNTNSAAYYLCQIGEGAPWNIRRSVLVELLSQVASKPCFHALRTVQRLGYTAGCQVHRLHGVLGFAVRVQSPNYPASHLRQRILQWLLDFRAELEQLPQERLQHFKDALEERYREPAKSLGDAAAQAWLPIRRGTLDFDTKLVKASLVGSITHEDLLEFYDCYISPSGPCHKALCCEVQGGSKDEGSVLAATDLQDPAAKKSRHLEGPDANGVPLGSLEQESVQSPAASQPSTWLVIEDAGLAALQRRLSKFPAKRNRTAVQPSRL